MFKRILIDNNYSNNNNNDFSILAIYHTLIYKKKKYKYVAAHAAIFNIISEKVVKFLCIINNLDPARISHAFLIVYT